MAKKGQHVVPRGDQWGVRKSGASKVTSLHPTQKSAIEAARQTAINQRAELYIHGEDGRIRERNSYGNDPHPPKG